MENLDHIAAIIALTMGASWASGINLYATLFMLGWMGSTGNIDLPPELQTLQNPLVLGAAGFMYCVEFFADKIPGVDTAWDTMHTFIRIPAGAMLASAAIGDSSAAMELAAAITGGGMAAATHMTKSGSRILINASPEPFSNWVASITEDISVIGGLWLALNHPWLFLAALLLFILLLIWLLPKLWRGIKKAFRFIGRLFGAGTEDKADDAAPASITNEDGTKGPGSG